MDDHILVRKIQAGDGQAFEALVRKHYHNIYAYCYRRIGDTDMAADLTQEVFLKLVASIYRYRPSGKFTNYLFTIAVNTCSDYLKKRRLYTESYDEVTAESRSLTAGETGGAKGRAHRMAWVDSTEAEVLLTEAKGVLYERLQELPDIQKETLILHYFHGLKLKDIGEITGVSVSTVKSRIYQGLAKLRKQYGKDGEKG